MEERGNIKTIMCSVLFLDIVEYSRKSVAGQISLKDRFNRYLSAALCDVPVTDRIILDTSDGAAINFIGDVEHALRVALSLRESLLSENTDTELSLQVHMGVNLGPVHLVRDANGKPNIVGDGINVAQHVMGFADANQILVSRSYYDAVAHLSRQYAGMFHYQGSRTDKHVREHDVYAVGYQGDAAPQQVSGNNIAEQAPGHHADAMGHAKLTQNSVTSDRPESRQRIMYGGVIAISVMLIGVLAAKLLYHDEAALPDVAPVPVMNGSQQVSADSSVVPVLTRAEDKAVGASAVQSTPASKKIVASKPAGKKLNSQAKQLDVQPKTKVSEASSKNKPMASTGSSIEKSTEAYVSISCDEGTPVFVDGMQKGKVGPAGLTLVVSPGKHLVIVNHASGNIYSRNVDLEPGKLLHIKPNVCK